MLARKATGHRSMDSCPSRTQTLRTCHASAVWFTRSVTQRYGELIRTTRENVVVRPQRVSEWPGGIRGVTLCSILVICGAGMACAWGEGGPVMGLPQGTVTFLFTDLEGSTRRWETHPEQMRAALARHNAIVREAVGSHGGTVFSTMGDGMAAVFPSAREAVRAVLAAQQGLGAEPWDEAVGPLTARMGLWTDEGVLGGEHYQNQPLNRCARLMAAGHGGQVLVSGATEPLVRDDLPGGCGLVDLGEHRLRDLARPVRIFQLTGPGLRAEFPPVRTLAAFAGNLPVQLSSFVGRAEELAGLAAAVAGSPLVTVTGPGGVGKTRLAVQAAADQLPSFADGAWLCELAAADDAESMAQVVAAALGVRSRPGLSTAGSVVEFLRTRSGLLLVLDNCEHLLAAAAALAADILRGCPGVRIVATSPGSRWGWRGSRCSGCGRCRCRRRMRMWRPRWAVRRWTCSCSGPPPRAASSRWARRTWPRWGRSAGGWTGSRWPSSWPPPGSGRCARPRSPGCWMSGSSC